MHSEASESCVSEVPLTFDTDDFLRSLSVAPFIVRTSEIGAKVRRRSVGGEVGRIDRHAGA